MELAGSGQPNAPAGRRGPGTNVIAYGRHKSPTAYGISVQWLRSRPDGAEFAIESKDGKHGSQGKFDDDKW